MDSLQPKAPLILVVEDSATQAEWLRIMLTDAGYRVTIARDGAQGLAAARKEPPAVILSDIIMPGMDGCAMCRAIRMDEVLKDTPVILLTRLSDAQDVIVGLNAGADFYITKPYREASLLPRVRAALAATYERDEERLQMETLIDGKSHRVDAGAYQMLNLLISTYDNAVQQYRELLAAQDELRYLNEHLEEKIREKTAALQASEAHLSALLEASPVGVFETDARGNCLFVNERWMELTGLKEEQASGRGWAQALHPEDRERVTGEWYATVTGELPFHSEYRFQRPDGTVTWAYGQATPLRDGHGKLTGYAGTITDITERKRTEEEISRLGAVVQQAGDSIVITDLDGNIVYVNPFCEQLTGYTAAEAIGQTPRILKSGHQNKQFYRQLWDTITAGRVWSGHFVNQRKDGSLYHEDATIFPIKDAKGRIINYAAVKKDVTQRMEAEAKIRKLTQLYATLSYTNETILRATHRDDLLRNICRGAVEHGRFALCWVGLTDEATRTVQPFCHAGRDDGYLDEIHVSVEDVPEGCGPTGTAVRESRVVYVNDYATDPRALPWRATALRQGFRGAAALPIRLGGKVIGAMTLYVDEPDFYDEDQVRLLEEMSLDISFALDGFEREAARQQAETARTTALGKLQKTLQDSIRVAASTLEMRDPYTAGHQQRVAQLATAIAREMNLSESEIEGIYFGCLIHDIGKIAVPAEILSKPNKLSVLEKGIIRTHAQMGYDLLKDIDFPWPVAQMILQHHERLNGSGYPHGLTAPEITLEARILIVADVVEAMSSHRPYRPGLGIDAALAEIESGRDALYDRQVVDICLKLFREKGFVFGDRA